MLKADKKYTDVVLVLLLLTLNIFRTFSGVSFVDFEQVTVSWIMNVFIDKFLHSKWSNGTNKYTITTVVGVVLVFLLLIENCKIFETLYVIWYYLYNLKNVKNNHGRVLLFITLQASSCNFTKSNTLPWVFYTFFK